MKKIIRLVAVEFRQLATKLNLIVALFLIALTSFLTMGSIESSRTIEEKTKDFVGIEKQHYSQLKNYRQYSIQGIRLVNSQAPLSSIFDEAGYYKGLTGRINPVATLSIGTNSKGKEIAPQGKFFYFDLSGIVYIFVNFISLFLGFSVFRNKAAHRDNTAGYSIISHFVSINAARLILLALFIAILISCSLFIGIIAGVQFTSIELLYVLKLYLSSLQMVTFFYLLSTIFSCTNAKNLYRNIVYLSFVWALFSIIIPGAINKYASEDFLNTTSDYRTEAEKIEIISQFEERAAKQFGQYSKVTKDVSRKIMQGYMTDDYKKVEATEDKLRLEIAGAINKYRGYTIVLPTTHYLSVTNEVSGKGYENFLAFYKYLQKLKRKFVNFWIDQVFFKESKMVNFVKSDENIFRAKSHIPSNFWTGVLINFLWCLLLGLIAFFRFHRYIYPLPKNKDVFKKLDLKMVSGKVMNYVFREREMFEQFLNVLSGKPNGFTGKISLDGRSIVTGESEDFRFILNPKDLPGELKVSAFLKTFKGLANLDETAFTGMSGKMDPASLDKRIEKLTAIEKVRLLLLTALYTDAKIYVFDHITASIEKTYCEEVKETFFTLRDRGALVIDVFPMDKDFWMVPDSFSVIGLSDGHYFERVVKSLEGSNN